MQEFALVLVVGLVAGTVGGVVGFGTAILLLPALVWAFGPQQAIPLMAIASVLANASRVAVWWREIDGRAVLAYALGGVPAAALGARTLLVLPPRSAEVAFGVFFLAMVPVRAWMMRRQWRLRPWHLALVGLVIGFLTGLVASTGPINTPFFLMAGLTRGAFLGTEALASLSVYLTKAFTFRALGALPTELIGLGLAIGTAIAAGSYVARFIVLRMDAGLFQRVMDLVMIASGSVLLAMAWLA